MDEHFQNLYRKALAVGKDEVYNIRVMIVGHQGVGKTSLTQRLLGNNVNENDTQSTEGIEVHTSCCQIDHATREWTTKNQTDEVFLHDQKIASILKKYTSSPNNDDTKEIDPVNGTSPRQKPIMSLHDSNTASSSLDGNIDGTKDTDGQLSNLASDDDVPRPQCKQKVHEECEATTCPEEIQNFVNIAPSLNVPNTRSSDVTLLDFAGQSIFYTTHQVFMSSRTIYLLVTDMSRTLTDSVEDGDYTIDVSGKKRKCTIQEYVTYWLNSIHSHTYMHEKDMAQREGNNPNGEKDNRSVQGTTRNHPFVILVGTHSDKIPKELLDETKRSYFSGIRIALKDTPLCFHLVDEDFAISNLGSDPSINALKTKIFETAEKQDYWGQLVPARWIPLEKTLMEIKNRGIKVMKYDDVKSLSESRQVRIKHSEELDLFLRFEHDMGHIVFFNTERLRKKVVLDPVWLIHGVRTWITSDEVIKRHPELLAKWSEFKNTGRLTRSLIGKLWSPYPEILENAEHLFYVMEKLNIIAKPLQTEEDSREVDRTCYWVPCMVSMPAPSDYAIKLQQNKDTMKTSTLCFKSKNNFIHVGVFHRLLATCLSKWPPAKRENTHLFFRGFCVFDLDAKHQLLLSLNDHVIQATVIRWTKQGRIPDLSLCKAIRDVLYTALSEISEYLCPGSELEICVKCKESAPLTNEGLHSISTLRIEDEVNCSTHEEAHCVESRELLGFWEEDKKQIPDNVLPQHSADRVGRFSRLSSLVLEVGAEILREILLCYISDLNCTLDQYMQMNKSDILNLQKRKVLTQAQVDILFPQSGQADIKQYDITLASALLKNICPLLGPHEMKLITDLREERNKLAHWVQTDMSEDDFQVKLTKIKTTLTELSKLCKDSKFEDTVKKKIQDIEQSGLCEILSKVAEARKELVKALRIIEELETLGDHKAHEDMENDERKRSVSEETDMNNRCTDNGDGTR